MGLLSVGTPLPWTEVAKHVEHVREHGVEQLIATYNKYKDRKGDCLKWGDEVEYMVVKLDQTRNEAKLTLRQDEILDALIEAKKRGELKKLNVSFHQEYGRYMLEATPDAPYTGEFSDLVKVEKNMEVRRETARKYMQDQEYPLTITVYPLMGVGKFAEPYEPPSGNTARSFFLPDNIINTHARFPTLTANIRSRRGSKVAINVPIYKDKNTPWPFHDPTIPWDRDVYPEDANAREYAAKDNHIYMDAMGFGMGCCCVQLTFQATDIQEATYLYDQLNPLAPIMLALSAAAPIYRGYLSDQDVRWNVISAAVDDRTPAERGLAEPDYKNPTTNDNSSPVIPKSRYHSTDSYLDNNEILLKNQEFYNDLPLVINKKVEKRIAEAGLPPMLVKHFSHLYIRDPLVIFEELLDQDDSVSTDHFENIQSTNWQTLRFKPPPNDDIGWRVEFRSMDAQITDFENAAFSVFIVLVTRVILSYQLTNYLPMSLIDANMEFAHKRDAIRTEKFWIRTNVMTQTPESDPGIKQLTLNEIINGSPEFIGFVPLVRQYLATMNADMGILCELDDYLTLVSKRASGELQSAASWIREFVDKHPDYKHDSVISEKINYDLLDTIEKITQGEWSLAPNMLPKKK